MKRPTPYGHDGSTGAFSSCYDGVVESPFEWEPSVNLVTIEAREYTSRRSLLAEGAADPRKLRSKSNLRQSTAGAFDNVPRKLEMKQEESGRFGAPSTFNGIWGPSFISFRLRARGMEVTGGPYI
jgi:hypothetical protein